MPTLAELGDIFRKSMWEALTGTGGNGARLPESTYLTWCQPGLPYTADDFDFAASGLNSTDPVEALKRAQHAFAFATQVDMVPDPSGVYRGQERNGVYVTTGDRLSTMYQAILNAAKVVDYPLTESQKTALEKARSDLFSVATQTDPDTGLTEEIAKESLKVRSARKYYQAYLEAALRYNSAATAAGSAAGPNAGADISYFQANGSLLRQQMNDAWGDYIANYGGDVARAKDLIRQLTEGGMVGWKNMLMNALMTPVSLPGAGGAQYFYTTVVPGGFASAPGWTTFSTSSDKVGSTWASKSTSWSAGGKVGWGFWSAGADASTSYTESSSNVQVSNFLLKFSLTQVTVVRPWFYPEWFTNRGWMLEPGVGWQFPKLPSDGGDPPDGVFVGYPVQLVFVKDVQIVSTEFAQAYKNHSSSTQASASVGWGPFTLRGSHGNSSSGGSFDSATTSSSVTVPGLQLIATINHLFDKAPNPDPSIPADRFV